MPYQTVSVSFNSCQLIIESIYSISIPAYCYDPVPYIPTVPENPSVQATVEFSRGVNSTNITGQVITYSCPTGFAFPELIPVTTNEPTTTAASTGRRKRENSVRRFRRQLNIGTGLGTGIGTVDSGRQDQISGNDGITTRPETTRRTTTRPPTTTRPTTTTTTTTTTTPIEVVERIIECVPGYSGTGAYWKYDYEISESCYYINCSQSGLDRLTENRPDVDREYMTTQWPNHLEWLAEWR